MTDLTIVERRIDVLDKVETVKSGRNEYDGEYFTAVYPSSESPQTYVVAQFSYESNNDTADIQISDNSILLNIENGNVLALVPSEAYGGDT
ncbi:hypothetical protein [Halorubrum saccharovorum]|uniref:hypothetical protein n=1 Tax=Halorubrum saccharovorum TaxID=2248 RepID=UPI001268859B|nr:hypothetical protein [Halorubrum saccharovorum]